MPELFYHPFFLLRLSLKVHLKHKALKKTYYPETQTPISSAILPLNLQL